MFKKSIILLCFLSGMFCAQAKVVMPKIFSDNMVLQQSTDARIWGYATANARVSLKTSWSGEKIVTKADAAGKWSTSIKTPKATYDPQTITISDGKPLTLSNILIGEVWVCSGQSNMEIPINGYYNCPIVGANELIATSSKYKGIRGLTVDRCYTSFTPQDTIAKGTWNISSPKTTPGFSAVAYYFGIMLNKVLDVPVGLLITDWPGSSIQCWMPERVVEQFPELDRSLLTNNKVINEIKPTLMYNGMLHPLMGYTIAGFIWYQGEGNVKHPETYAGYLESMVKSWREDWKEGELPFYYVEVAPYFYEDSKGIQGALLREAQNKAAKVIPNSGIISTNDLVEPYEFTNPHPKNKLDVGNRLAYLALNHTYKIEGIASECATYKSMEIQGNKIILSFDHIDGGFNRIEDIQGFEIAGADKIFHKATARVFNESRISVESLDVSNPVAVRYCFHNFQIGNLGNTRGLPLVPFRTDNWDK
jgi:sialate O-acetylesterase